MPSASRGLRRPRDPDHRGHRRRPARSGAGGVHPRRRVPVRLLHARPDHEPARAAGRDRRTVRRGDPARGHRKPLPLRRLRQHPAGRTPRRRAAGGVPAAGRLGRRMPRFHVRKLRKGRGEDDEYKVVDAVALPAWGGDAKLTVVGRSVPRVEGAEKVTGRARYAYDVRLPGQLYARVLRCPLPHARIRALSTERAAQLRGARAILSSENAPAIEWYDAGALFDRTLRFAGEEVVAVAADSEDIAADALALVEVEYEPLPFVLTIEDALRPGAPRVREGGNVAGKPDVYERGDPEDALRRAEVVVDETYTTQTALHNCLEPHGCTAAWDGDRLTLWESTQSIYDV